MEMSNMQYMTQYDETETFQKLRKQRKRENADAWGKEEKPWRQLQREKQKRKYDNLQDVV